MDDALAVDRFQFAFTVTYHYIFPQLTMGLALLILILKTIGLWKNSEKHEHAACFWARIFGITFVIGVITGIPMEFQFGTIWAMVLIAIFLASVVCLGQKVNDLRENNL